MKDTGSPWTIRGEREVYDNPWIRLTEYDVLNPAGGQGIYGKVHFKNIAVGIVPLDDQGHIHLVGQYRFTLSQYSWEIPEGGSPTGTDPLASAKRELQEEVGMSAAHWQQILELHLSNSVSDEHGFVYLATGLTQGKAEPEETEDLEARSIPFGEAVEMIIDGRITDAMSIAAILRVRLMIDRGEITLKKMEA
jgi:8-oxo-dGTP pyrophosphatase MutT (NUDIX family)